MALLHHLGQTAAEMVMFWRLLRWKHHMRMVCWLSWISLQRKGHRAWQRTPVSEGRLYSLTVKRTKAVPQPFICLSKYTRITQSSSQGRKGLQQKSSAEGHPNRRFQKQLCVKHCTNGGNLMKGHTVRGHGSRQFHLPGSGVSFMPSAGPEARSSNPCMFFKPCLQWTKCPKSQLPAGLAGQFTGTAQRHYWNGEPTHLHCCQSL